MNLLERSIAAVAPRWAMSRARARAVTAHYDAAGVGRRTSSMKAARTDADAAARQRLRMAWYARDMVRNTPFAARAQSVICGGIVGDGILPKVVLDSPELNDTARKLVRDRGLKLIEAHFDTCAIDRQGRQNLYGLQRLVANTVVDAGECLVRVYRSHPDPKALQLQLDVLEPDFLDESKFGLLGNGNEIRDGIEYDAAGHRVAYWLFTQHPGGDWSPGRRPGISERIPAGEILHVFRQDRPGQMRGVTWFAPVMMRLQDLADHEDAQLMRQKIAACFAAFRVRAEGGKDGEIKELAPGLIYDLGEDEDIKFATPPSVEGYDEFTRSALRSVAAGMGVTYEALTGDLGQVNFSSARMGRLEMDQNISAWQWLMLIPQMMQPLAAAFVDAWNARDGADLVKAGLPADIWHFLRLEWQPPRKVIVDPTREITALGDAVRNGFASRQQVVRQLGVDPERLIEEIAQDRADARRLGLSFDSDPGAKAGNGPPPGEAEEAIRDRQVES
ncbi:phage portal protein [Paracoccus sp. MBLB3053]|uniref:Phage portal protein n=1 Tax=Paracoccus aurantius TaxID=3073814 RepID=A0ABU2HQM8_9RHOB|nr:phage portal protein [Paracoccus sp. MBLB3053]MDS9467343.1 phage portal protein [Paracoccus sp. MBLB3053]